MRPTCHVRRATIVDLYIGMTGADVTLRWRHMRISPYIRAWQIYENISIYKGSVCLCFWVLCVCHQQIPRADTSNSGSLAPVPCLQSRAAVCCQLKNRQPNRTQVCHKKTRRARVTIHGQCCLEKSAALAVLAKINMKKNKKKTQLSRTETKA